MSWQWHVRNELRASPKRQQGSNTREAEARAHIRQVWIKTQISRKNTGRTDGQFTEKDSEMS